MLSVQAKDIVLLNLFGLGIVCVHLLCVKYFGLTLVFSDKALLFCDFILIALYLNQVDSYFMYYFYYKLHVTCIH